MKKHLVLLFMVLLLAGCSSTKKAAENEQKALKIRAQIEATDFTFRAVTALPMRFQPVNLTSEYDLKVSKDTVKAWLPYFGVAYVAPMNPREGGFQFTSTKFDYQLTKGKKAGNWIVTIVTHDTERDITFYLDLWETGSAHLVVQHPDKQSITFHGEIEFRRAHSP
jgi:hypothetical protein